MALRRSSKDARQEGRRQPRGPRVTKEGESATFILRRISQLSDNHPETVYCFCNFLMIMAVTFSECVVNVQYHVFDN